MFHAIRKMFHVITYATITMADIPFMAYATITMADIAFMAL